MRPSWNGHLRLSLVSCPIGLVPATTEVERIKLNQLNPKTGNRISLKPVDSETGEPLERSEIVKGYKLEGDQYVILENEELKDLQVESSRILDLEAFVDRASVDPIYMDAPYYIYPEKVGLEAYRVIAEAMAADKKAAIGRIVLSTREHPVLVEPRGGGLMMFLLRTADEVRSAEYDFPEVKIDRKMVEIAGTIMERQAGHFEPAQFIDRYQEALRELIKAKAAGRGPTKTKAPVIQGNVVDLMDALRRSLEDGQSGAEKPRADKTSGRERLRQNRSARPRPISGSQRCCSRSRGTRQPRKRPRRQSGGAPHTWGSTAAPSFARGAVSLYHIGSALHSGPAEIIWADVDQRQEVAHVNHRMDRSRPDCRLHCQQDREQAGFGDHRRHHPGDHRRHRRRVHLHQARRGARDGIQYLQHAGRHRRRHHRALALPHHIRPPAHLNPRAASRPASLGRSFADPEVAAVFEAYSPALRRRLLHLRALIFAAAADLPGTGGLVEILNGASPPISRSNPRPAARSASMPLAAGMRAMRCSSTANRGWWKAFASSIRRPSLSKEGARFSSACGTRSPRTS